MPAILTGYGEPLTLTLSNGTGDLGETPDTVACLMAEAIAGLEPDNRRTTDRR